MTILSAMQSAAIRLVGYRPQVFFGSSEKFESEITDLVNEVARDIVAHHDWQALKRIHEITGDGVTTAFPMPDDYDRQLLVTSVQDLNSWVFGYTHIQDINQFMFDRARGFSIVPGAWTIYGNQMQFYPAPTTGGTASFPYISKNYAMAQSTALQDEFTQDTDEFVINRADRLLTLGLIWRWRENKKLDYTGDQEAFALALDQVAAKDSGSNVITRNSRSFRGLNTRLAWPWPLGGV